MGDQFEIVRRSVKPDLRVELLDPATGDAYSLAGVTQVRLVVATRLEAQPADILIDAVMTIEDVAGGVCRKTWASGETAALPIGKHYGMIECTTPGGLVNFGHFLFQILESVRA